MSKLDYFLIVCVIVAITLAIYWQVQVGNEMKGL